MRRALVDSLPRHSRTPVEIPESESKHLTSVLRLGPGDLIELLDGKGMRARGSLLFRDKRVFAELSEEPSTDPKLCSLPIHLAMSIIKGEAMEWVVEKAVELGVRSLTPIDTEFSVVDLRKKGPDSFRERWQRIADQALKQCGRLDRMEIKMPIGFEAFLLENTPVFWLDETLAQEGTPGDHLALAAGNGSTAERTLLVGPEGGLSASERARLLQLTVSGKKAITRVHLGSLILRAETAAMMGISLLIGDHYGKGKNPIQAAP